MKLFSIDNYVHGYLDRRMEAVIDEWNLARKGDVADFSKRIDNVEKEIGPMKEYEKAASAKLAGLHAVFTADLTATTFVEDGGVATSSWLFVALAVCFGLSEVYRFKIPVVWSTLVFVPLVFLGGTARSPFRSRPSASARARPGGA